MRDSSISQQWYFTGGKNTSTQHYKTIRTSWIYFYFCRLKNLCDLQRLENTTSKFSLTLIISWKIKRNFYVNTFVIHLLKIFTQQVKNCYLLLISFDFEQLKCPLFFFSYFRVAILFLSEKGIGNFTCLSIYVINICIY